MAHMDEIRDMHLNRAFIGFQARCRTFLRTRFARKRVVQLEMILKIQKNARVYVALSGWSWWKLYSKVKPLTSITRMDEELQEKKETIFELEQIVKQKESDFQKHTELNRSLEQEKNMLIEQLEAERQIAEDNSEILSRAQEKLSQTLEELQDVTADLRNAESELENAKKAQEVNVETIESLQSDIQEKETSISHLKSQQAESLQKVHNASQKLMENATEIEKLTQRLASSQGENEKAKTMLEEKEMELNDAKKDISRQRQESLKLNQVISDNIAAYQKKLQSVEEDYKVCYNIEIEKGVAKLTLIFIPDGIRKRRNS
jgi:myosin protein heavy chain